jgi:hypothetical protein
MDPRLLFFERTAMIPCLSCNLCVTLQIAIHFAYFFPVNWCLLRGCYWCCLSISIICPWTIIITISKKKKKKSPEKGAFNWTLLPLSITRCCCLRSLVTVEFMLMSQPASHVGCCQILGKMCPVLINFVLSSFTGFNYQFVRV